MGLYVSLSERCRLPSLANSASSNAKALQHMLCHASAAMTLDRYADLFEDDLDAVAAALHQARAKQTQQ
jgi:hypothetical protein